MSTVQHIENDDITPGGLSEEKLMAYLAGRLEGDELREVELLLAEEGMEGDALEGLQSLDPKEARKITGILNRQLDQSLKKKKRRGRRGIMEQKWALIAVAVILLLAIICFAILWLMKQA